MEKNRIRDPGLTARIRNTGLRTRTLVIVDGERHVLLLHQLCLRHRIVLDTEQRDVCMHCALQGPSVFKAVLGIRVRMFLGFPDPLVRGTDPAPDPDYSLFS
jgi:hypothetical protein